MLGNFYFLDRAVGRTAQMLLSELFMPQVSGRLDAAKSHILDCLTQRQQLHLQKDLCDNGSYNIAVV